MRWLISYISNRKIMVKVHKAHSSQFEMELGEPQSSVLGSLIFLLFVNDLPYYIVAEKIIIFVDDTSFVVKAKSVGELVSLYEILVENFKTWCHANGLILNVEKMY